MSWLITGSQKVNWDPSLITTALWLDAADASTLTIESGAISQWNDKSGNGRHASQATPGARPVLANSFVTFDGTNDFMRNTNAEILENNASTFTAYIVNKLQDTTNSRFYFLYGTDSNRHICHQSLDNNEYWYASQGNGDYATLTKNIDTAIRGWVFDGSLSGNSNRLKVYRNGGQLSPGYAGTVSNNFGTLTHGFYLSSRSNGAVIAQELGEIVITRSALDTTTRQKLEGYLAHKWGLTANLPGDHPFKVNPPAP